MIRKISVAIVLCISTLISLAQDFTVVQNNGEKCFQHKVEAGHTLYAIATLYNSDEEIIKKYNAEVLAEGLKVGQTIYIPVNSDIILGKVTNPVRIEDGFLVHRVLKKETLFSICKRYTVDVNDVLALNPEANNGLKKGQELKIPVNDVNQAVSVAPPVTFEKPEWKTHQVLPGETLYGISKLYEVKINEILDVNDGLPEGLKARQFINLPIKPDVTETQEKDSLSVTDIVDTWKPRVPNANPYKSIYNVAVALPLYTNKLGEEKLSRKEGRIQSVGLNFYRGVLMAAEQLKKEGLSMNLHVVNAVEDKDIIEALPSDKNLQETDVFLGPFQKKALSKVIEIASGNYAHVVCPTPQSGKVLLSNPNVSKVCPSGSTKMGETAQVLADDKDEPKVILVTTKWVKDKRNIQVFRREYEAAFTDSLAMSKRSLIEIAVEDLTAAWLKNTLSDGEECVLVLPTEEKVALGKLVNMLPFMSRYDNLTIYLTEKWIDSEYLDAEVRNKFNIHFPTGFSHDYSNETIQLFEEEYKLLYDSAPDEYSILGHDIMLYYGRGLMNHGLNFSYHFSEIPTKGLVDTKFDFKPVGPDSGFENHGHHLMYYEDYELKEKL